MVRLAEGTKCKLNVKPVAFLSLLAVLRPCLVARSVQHVTPDAYNQAIDDATLYVT